MIEAIVKDQWHDCKIVKVIPPTEEEIKADLAEDEEERKKEEEKKKDSADGGSSSGSPKKKKEKEKKAFSPADHLFKYQVVKIEPEEHEANEVSIKNKRNISVFFFKFPTNIFIFFSFFF